MPQHRYWVELNHLKTQVNFAEGLCAKLGDIDTRLKIVTSVTSSASIGGWLIWKDYAFVWASIVALSQVINAITPVLAFNERKKTFSALAHDLDALFNLAEAKWYDIAEGKIEADKINRERTHIRQQRSALAKKHFPNSMIPKNQKILDQAEADSLAYFASFYPTGE